MKFKKLACLLMAGVIAVASFNPLQVKASGVPSPEVVDSWMEGEVDSASHFYRTVKRQIVAFKPTSVTGVAQKSSFVINANVTTAARTICVQWSTDKTFKTNVKTRFFRNTGFKATVNSFETWGERIGYNGKLERPRGLVIKQGFYKVLYSKQTLARQEHEYLVPAQSIINEVRKKVSCVKRLYVPNVEKPKRYYVRLRSAYDGITNETVYSPWSAVIKLK